MKKNILVIIMLICFSSFLFASGDKEEEQQETVVLDEVEFDQETGIIKGKPYAGTKINVISLNYTWSQAIKELLPEFMDQTGIEVNMELYGSDVVLQKTSFALSTGSSTYDAMQLGPFSVAQFMYSGWLTSLQDFIDNPMHTNKKIFNQDDFFDVSLKFLTYKDKLMALPIFSATICMYYREDILNKYGLEPPETFEELREVVATIDSPEIAGIVLRGARGIEFNMWPFPLFIHAMGGGFFENIPDDLHPTLTDEGSIKAGELFVDLLKNYSIEGVASATHKEMILAMQQGKAAITLDGTPLAGVLLNPELATEDVIKHLKAAPTPKGPAGRFPAQSEHGLGIPAESKNKEAAWEFIKWATSEKIQLEASLLTPYIAVTRKSVKNDSKYMDKYNYFDGEFLDIYTQMQEEAKGKPYIPLIPEWQVVGDIIGKELNAATVGDKSVENAFSDANKAVYDYMKSNGKISE